MLGYGRCLFVCMASIMLGDGVVRVAVAAGAAHTDGAGQRGARWCRSCPATEAVLSIVGLRVQKCTSVFKL